MFKKYGIGLMALLIAVATFAFSKAPATTKDGHPSAAFFYNSALGSNQRLAANYTLGSITCDNTGTIVCNIQAPSNGAATPKPVFATGTNPVDNPDDYDTETRH